MADVQVGQIYIDRDKRTPGRRVQVQQVFEDSVSLWVINEAGAEVRQTHMSLKRLTNPHRFTLFEPNAEQASQGAGVSSGD